MVSMIAALMDHETGGRSRHGLRAGSREASHCKTTEAALKINSSLNSIVVKLDDQLQLLISGVLSHPDVSKISGVL